MATILLSAAGAALGGSLGGGIAGLSSVAIGRLAGATLGRVIDQSIMGSGSDVVESGKVDRFRLTSAAEGAPVAQLYGRMRLGGQVIWASRFVEHVEEHGGGKGMGMRPGTREYSYSVSLALSLCEGEISGVGRIWADGKEINRDELNLRVYSGAADQVPDPKIEAVEGVGQVPAYRGTAYVVFEDLDLAPFGNRVPQFSFEVSRPVPLSVTGAADETAHAVRAVALIPGSGEYALATTPVHYKDGDGGVWSANVHAASGVTDFEASMRALEDELPNCGAVSLVVSWFGSDLRCGHCEIRPKVEGKEADGAKMPWQVCGTLRAEAEEIARVDDRPVYGGTPSDASVIEAIMRAKAGGKAITIYPFILMDQLQGNGLPDPWSDAEDQPVLPWRGRITLETAPGREGSSDGTMAAGLEVAAFFGAAQASDFDWNADGVTYSGPEGWRYRRFILHHAALAAAAGGVDAFCIGSEMRGMTRIRGADGFVVVSALRDLAAEVREILGPDVQITYAADWSEYFGYQPQDGSGDVFFNLDPLWADPNIDFIGIDNYMPLSDWRDGDTHADAHWGSIYEPDYLEANVAGGEGYDWYYHSAEAEAAQIRTPIEDGAYGEHWVFRPKDIRGWWENTHHERVGGVRSATPTDWEPGAKPIVFMEYGCAAVDKGTNQPNRFFDPKSSESGVPRASDRRRDELIQQQYLRAMNRYWRNPANNPVSSTYDGAMVDMDRAHVWAWDTRPYPAFPNDRAQWSDGENWARGHWISGRSAHRSLAGVVDEICARAGVAAWDSSQLFGVVRGYVVADVAEARAALQPLMLRFGFDAIERDGVLCFVMRDGRQPQVLDRDRLAVGDDTGGQVVATRSAEAELAGRVRVQFVQADADFAAIAEEAVLADEATHAVARSELAMALTRAEGRQISERWLTEARVARDTVRLALPPSAMALGAGDVVALEQGLFRIDRVEAGPYQVLDGVRIEPAVYTANEFADEPGQVAGFVPPFPVRPLFMDLPLIRGDEAAHAPHLAVTADPWPGSVAVYDAATDGNYALNSLLTRRAVTGVTETPLLAAGPGRMDRGDVLQVRLHSGALESVSDEALLSGSNLAAIGDGSSGNWELFQFRDAELVDTDTWLLGGRLRGQAGSDALMPADWPPGSRFVLLDGAVGQIELASSLRNVARHYRIGPSRRGYDDPSYEHLVEAFAGNGLRPYAPCHLRIQGEAGADLAVSWIRRTRLDGDSWEPADVPLGEEREEYLLRVIRQGAVLRETPVHLQSTWTYTASEQAEDGAVAPFELQVAQVSARYGAGPAAGIVIGG